MIYMKKNSKILVQRSTVRMSRAELDAILQVDTALSEREAIHERPTVQMEAVRPSR